MAVKMDNIRQRIQSQIPDNIRQLPETLKPKPAHHLDNGADSIPATLAPTLVSPVLPTPTLGHDGAVFTIAYATPIAKPPLAVLAAFVNPATYPSWNPMFPKVTVNRVPTEPLPPLLAGSSVADAKPADLMLEGAQVTFEVHLGLDPAKPSANSHCIITKLEDFNKVITTTAGGEHKGLKGYRVAWKTTGYTPPTFLLRAERVHEFLETEDGGGTEYRCYETFYGPLAHIVKLTLVGQLEAAFTAWMDGLKRFVESGGDVAPPAAAPAAAAGTNGETTAEAAPASAAAAAAAAAS
ncbi:hypothetical protein CkaCkLH20_13182 [Colletotrichum karsti]|uniref:Uncharacterized protein n=1 Tax=Colletotrichum karsti TaxID=1095194 RepID=A0A9P6HSN3_9PEZI|nr:uncharacterized protein CkaCkLH20_13182 [Colletotrichum karsti]KAF9869344.1 hypothetical protein CkaCkLH20_13182 [Colletotrichum karsti]